MTKNDLLVYFHARLAAIDLPWVRISVREDYQSYWYVVRVDDEQVPFVTLFQIPEEFCVDARTVQKLCNRALEQHAKAANNYRASKLWMPVTYPKRFAPAGHYEHVHDTPSYLFSIV